MKTKCENRLLSPVIEDNAALGTTLSNLPMFTLLDVKTGALYPERVMTEVKTDTRSSDLAKRCIEAEGPDRDIDKRIAFGGANIHEADAAPRYTGDLGAALSLIPRGERRIEFGTYATGGAWAYVWSLSGGEKHADAEAATEALAICAAAFSTSD